MLILSFDLDGTLFPNNIDDRLWFELIPEELARARKISIKEAREFAIREYDIIGPHDPRWYIPEYWLDRFKLDIEVNHLLQKMDYHKYLYPDILHLKELEIPIVIASNNARSMLDKKVEAIEGLGVKVHATFSVVSDIYLTGKDRRFYSYISNMLGVEPYKIMHIGDNILYDLINARASGFRSILIDRRDRTRDDDIIHSLYELDKYINLH